MFKIVLKQHYQKLITIAVEVLVHKHALFM